MPTRQINSPGVEIREIDRSQVSPAIVGTNVLVAGYANKGEAYEPVDIVSVSDLETNFGEPKNEAERYFYHACKNVINENGNLVAAKLPYANTMDVNYKYVGLTVETAVNFATLQTTLSSVPSGALVDLSGSSSVTQYSEVTVDPTADITIADYDVLVAGGNFTSTADFIIVNEKKSTLTGVDENEGLFITVVDPIHGMLAQRIISESDDDAMNLVQEGDFTGASFTENITGTYRGSSVSEDFMRYFPPVAFTENGDDIDPYTNNQVTIVVARTISNESKQGDLDVAVVETFTGSLLSDAIDASTGRSLYIGDIINDNSRYIKFYATTPANNPIALTDSELLFTVPQPIDALSFDSTEADTIIDSDNVVTDLEVVFSKVSNIEERQIDVVADGGLSTIAQFISDTGITSGTYYDPINDSSGEITGSGDTAIWRSVASSLDNFCKNVRKDCMAIVDGPRNLVLEGNQKYIRKTAPTQTFSNTISPKLKYITGLNSSYVAVYIDWMKNIDNSTGLNFWMPPSVKAAGIYVRNDRIANIWDAPAGLNRGIISEINDIAFNPIVKEADQVYTKSLNYCKHNTLDGFSLEGQKTSQTRPSAFDRVNVRRLFLRLERFTYQTARYFVFEPNNLFTRRRLISQIEPLFQSVKAQGGLYDYKIICDQTNNTPEVIDANELKVTILLKPVRTSEFVLVDFVATRTDANFDELV